MEEPEELLNELQARRRIIRIIGIAVALAVILWAWVVTISLIDGLSSSHGYVSETITEIDRIEMEE